MVPSHHKGFISFSAIVLWCKVMSNKTISEPMLRITQSADSVKTLITAINDGYESVALKVSLEEI